MNESTGKQSRGSIILNVIIGVTAFAGVIWLVMHGPACH